MLYFLSRYTEDPSLAALWLIDVYTTCLHCWAQISTAILLPQIDGAVLAVNTWRNKHVRGTELKQQKKRNVLLGFGYTSCRQIISIVERINKLWCNASTMVCCCRLVSMACRACSIRQEQRK